MTRSRFARDDLLRTRFAVSPLFEATASVAALRDPAAASLHLPWVRAARAALGDLDLSLLDALVGPPSCSARGARGSSRRWTARRRPPGSPGASGHRRPACPSTSACSAAPAWSG